ncbi:MAG: DUF2808 domain-containing protein [Geitlerinemataceae cyanobacterium]
MLKKIAWAISSLVMGLLALPVDRAFADGTSTHLSRATALPRTSQLMYSGFVNNYINFHVHDRSLSQISIELPPNVTLNKGIEITNESGQPIEANISTIDRQIQIVFAAPVPPETQFEIVMKGMKSRSLSGRTWLYPISIRSEGLNAEIPLETARIATY